MKTLRHPAARLARLAPKLETADQRRAHQAWMERACELVDGFVDARQGHEGHERYDGMTIWLVLHSTADFLFDRLRGDACFERLDPGALIALIARVFPQDVRTVATVLCDFYRWLTESREITPARGRYLACYFETLLELDRKSLRSLSRRCGGPYGRRLSRTGS